MIHDLDETLRRFLIQELPINNNEIDIRFDQPNRDWSTRIGNRPTLNMFLYDLRENKELRQTRPMWDVVKLEDGTKVQRRRPVRMDLHYMITAWAAEPEDEHRLLTGALMAFLRYPHVPEDLLTENLQDQPVPMPIMVAQYDELRNPADVWSALDNEVKPALVCIITLSVNPYQPVPVAEAVKQPPEIQYKPPWTVGGKLESERDLASMRMTLVELKREVPIDKDGSFIIRSVPAGNYTLEVAIEGEEKPRRYDIQVPAPDYTFKLQSKNDSNAGSTNEEVS